MEGRTCGVRRNGGHRLALAKRRWAMPSSDHFGLRYYGHEFQVKFHWHLEDQGIRHTYIKPRMPRLNGKVERSPGTDQREFYQLLTYKDDVDLNAKLAEWEAFYNYHRPHGSLELIRK